LLGLIESIRFKLLKSTHVKSKKSIFLFFYSRGLPWDKGFNLSTTAEEINEKLRPYFIKVVSHNKQTLKEIQGSEHFCNEFSKTLDKNPNANNFGYFDFKPFLINHELQSLKSDETLVYHDGNFIRNAQYWESDWQNIDLITNYLMTRNRSSIWVQFEGYGNLVKHHVKEQTLNFFFNSKEKNLVKKSHLINAARVIVKNDEFGREFIGNYKKYCEDKNVIFNDELSLQDEEFLWSCGDQDVLNCLVYRNILDGNLGVLFPRFAFFYRIIEFSRRNIIFHSDTEKRQVKTGIYPLYNFNLILYVVSHRILKLIKSEKF